MKKTLVMAMLAAFAMMNSTVYAQSVAKQLKSPKKALEARVKELSKDNWKSLNSDGLAMAVSEHNNKRRNNPNLYEIVGTAEQVESTNIGKAQARNNAINEYAELCGGMLRARITSDVRNVNKAQADNLVSGYERILSKKLEGEVRPSYYVYKDLADGKYNVRGFFLIDEARIEKIQKEAIKEASEEANLAHDYGEGISDFVKQGFNQ